MLNRRHFIQLGATGVAAAHLLRKGFAAESRTGVQGRRTVPSLVRKLLTTPVTGFPTVMPLFAASLVPGTGPVQMVRTETWEEFAAQVQSLSAQGYVLSCFTTIQNMNRTWFYGAFLPGKGAFSLLQTTDPNEFQQTFTQNQGASNLVDFNIAWELGQLNYYGYWLASGTPQNQTLVWNLNFNDLVAQWDSLNASNNRMTRIQAFPQQD